MREPFNVMAMYHDDRFTCIEATPAEPPAVYEIKDGKDSLIQFDLNIGITESNSRQLNPCVRKTEYFVSSSVIVDCVSTMTSAVA